MSEELGELSSPRAGARLAGAVVLLPVGSLEPHGPHLPLETDTILAREASRRTAARREAAGVRAVVAPAVPFAVAEFARDFPGAVSVPADTTAAFVRDAAAALLRTGAARVVLVTLHFEPAHLAALRRAAGGAVVFPELARRANARRIGGEFATGSCHAGAFETSLVLAARPDLVDDRVRAGLGERFVPLPDRMAAGASSFLECGMPEGYCGSPATASREEGERLYGVIAEILAEAARA
jgi:creatinine amidohydrolase